MKTVGTILDTILGHSGAGSDSGYNSDEGYNSGEDDGEVDVRTQLENWYWQAEDMTRSDPLDALNQFNQYLEKDAEVAMDRSKIWPRNTSKSRMSASGVSTFCIMGFELDWVNSRTCRFHEELLNFMPNATRNERQKAVEDILKEITRGNQSEAAQDFTTRAVSLTLNVLQNLNVDARLTFSIQRNPGQPYLNRGNVKRVEDCLTALKRCCQRRTGKKIWTGRPVDSGDHGTGAAAVRPNQRFSAAKLIHKRTSRLEHAVVDPSVMAVIHEDCGRMYMREERWGNAYSQFWAAFNKTQRPQTHAPKLV